MKTATPKHSANLRQRAEDFLDKNLENLQSIHPEDIQKLIHELSIHQIELEMQNEKLRCAQEEIVASRNRFSDLYDFAPVGYFTLNERGQILEVNLTGANILGVERRYLIKRGFSGFIAPNYQDVFYQHHLQTFKSREKQNSQLKLIRKDGTPFYAQIESIAAKEDEGNFTQLFITITDITERKRLSQEMERIGWLLKKSIKPKTTRKKEESYEQDYGDLAELNASGLIKKTVGKDLLVKIIGDYLDLLESSAAIYEKDGKYALGIFTSGWCRFLDKAARNLCGIKDNAEALNSGKWLCHESCWSDASKPCIEKGQPVDIECNGGIHIYAVPIIASGEVVGSMNFGYGDPPQDSQKLREIAEKYRVSLDKLRHQAGQYDSHPQFIIDIAKNRILTSARLLGEIIERKSAEESLRKLAAVVQDSNDAITVQSKDGDIVSWNQGAERMYCYTEAEASKINIKTIIPDDKKKEWTNFVEEIFKGNLIESFETQRLTKDGKILDVWLTITILKDDKGNPKFIATTERDITEQKRAEKELDRHRQHLEVLVKERTEELVKINKELRKEITERKTAEEALNIKQQEIKTINKNLEKLVQEEIEKNRQKDYIMIQQSRLAAMGEMIRYISHQWGQPIYALQLLIYNLEELIKNTGIEEKVVDNLIAKGLQLIKRIFTTMDDFKSFFQADKEKVTFSINKNIKDTLSLFGASFKYCNIPITLHEKEELMISGFPNEFSQVILNILKNAKDAIVEKGINGKIKIDLLSESNSAVVRIRDNGGGIPEDILEKIFDSYFSTKKEGKASGIGLYMSKVIIEKHMNGHITAQNAGDGAEFEIVTPMIQ